MSIDINSIIQRVTDTIRTETVIGEPITVSGVTLIPVINVSFGFGAGGGDARPGGNDQGNGAGGGGGARMTVAGMMVVRDGDVSFIPTGKGSGKAGPIDKILEALPDLIQKVSVKMPTKPQEKDEPDAQ